MGACGPCLWALLVGLACGRLIQYHRAMKTATSEKAKKIDYSRVSSIGTQQKESNMAASSKSKQIDPLCIGCRGNCFMCEIADELHSDSDLFKMKIRGSSKREQKKQAAIARRRVYVS